jgi:hypothetical protein
VHCVDDVTGGILVDSMFVFARVWNVMVLGFSNPAAHECSAACGAVPDDVFPGTLKEIPVWSHSLVCVRCV